MVPINILKTLTKNIFKQSANTVDLTTQAITSWLLFQ